MLPMQGAGAALQTAAASEGQGQVGLQFMISPGWVGMLSRHGRK